ncbi:Gfo/Idh/MocA family oxidoreductase [Akkermansiaceae bacterium]|nr:Gfo/Idh/MocA family oxidoreductase [Akkermansiaceae bacterium]
MKKSTKVCIVGLGRAGRFHLASIKKLDSIELKYVVDPALSTRDDIVQNNDFILLEDIEEALADDELDAAIISPPTQFHFDCVTRFLKAGKHVFTEKPLGESLAEIQTCFELSAKQSQKRSFQTIRRDGIGASLSTASHPSLSVGESVAKPTFY